MNKRLLGLAFAVGLGVSVLAMQHSAAANPQDDPRIEELIKKLGSGNYNEREKARQALETIGLPALEQLRQAAKKSDLETKTRCDKLIKKLEDKLAAETLLAPKIIKLDLKEVSVTEALQELQRQSGYTIQVDGDRTPLNTRKITLQTGEVSFWEAFDLLCAKGQLMELANRTGITPYQTLPGGGIIRQPAPVQILPIQVQPIQKVAPRILPVPAVPPPAPPPVQKNGANVRPPVVDVPPMQEQIIQLQIELPAVGGNGQAGVAVDLPLKVGQDPANGQIIAQGKAAPAVDLPLKVGQDPANGQNNAQGKAAAGAAPAGAAQKVQPKVRPLPAPVPQPVPGGGIRNNYPAGSIVVRDGQPSKVPTCYHGALRIRLLPASAATEVAVKPAQDGEALFILDVTPEPRLQQFSVVGSPRIDKALDDRGVALALAMEPMPDANAVQFDNYGYRGLPRQVGLRLKLGDKQAKAIIELKGMLTVQALTVMTEAIITVDDVQKAAGKGAKTGSGGSIEVLSYVKQPNGTYKVQIRYQQPQQIFPGNDPNGGVMIMPAVIQGNAANGVVVQNTTSSGMARINGLPVLVDVKGKALTLEQTPQNLRRAVNGVVMQEITMIFRAGTGVGEPAQMVLHGHRMLTAEAKFQFANVQLP